MNYDNLVIENLIAQGESKRVVLLPVLDREEIGRTICAFANKEGGDILVGFDENLTPLEIDSTINLDELSIWLSQSLKPQVPVSVRQTKYKNKNIIHISVWPGANKPYSFRNEIYVSDYITTTTTTTIAPADSDELSQLINERKANEFHWERQTVLGAEISDLDLFEVKETIKEYGKNKSSAKELSTEEFLIQTGLMRGGSLTNAAIILFAVIPSRYLPQCKMRITVYPEDRPGNTFLFDKQFEGNLFKNINSAWDFFENYLFSWSRIEGLKREKNKLPRLALREGLLNALVHRDYSLSMNYINISLYSNRLEINNPGELPNGIDLSDLKIKHPSVLRNPDIAQICFIRGYIEMLGTGTLRMIDDCISNGYKEPEWQVGNNRTFLTFPDIKGILANEGVNEGVSEELSLLYHQIEKYPGKKANELNEQINKSVATTERYLKILKEQGFIEFRGAPKTGGYYKID